MPTVEQVADWKGRKVVGNNEDKLGTIDEIYLDDETGKPEWLAVSTGMFGTKVTFIPLAEAHVHEDHIHVPFDKDLVKAAPNAEADGALSQDEESLLYQHYGYDYSEARSDSGLPDGGSPGADQATDGQDTSGPETDSAMTRSEEELRIGTTSRETGRVRLKKYIVTEMVTKTVPVQREEVRIEREDITDANRDQAMAGGELTEDEHEVVLHTEEPVIEKNVVAKERVRLDTDTVTDEVEVNEELRKERIDIDQDGASR